MKDLLHRLEAERDETFARLVEHINRCTADCSQLGLLCRAAGDLARKLDALRISIQGEMAR